MLHTTRRGALRGVAGLLAGVAGGWPLVQAHAYPLSTPWGNKALLALNRLAFGPAPGDLQRVQAEGVDNWIARQLQPQAMAQPAGLQQALNGLATFRLSPAEMFRAYGAPSVQGMEAVGKKEARRDNRQLVMAEAQQQRLWQAIYSPRQLQEVLLAFWANHFNVFIGKNLTRLWVSDLENTAIRPRVLGKFRDLLGAVAQHPAMLFYLDNWRNKREAINENYGRELMELHTLGATAGYTQQDVVALARALTGWTIDQRGMRQGGMQAFVFDARMHDAQPITLLGQTLPGSGQQRGEAALDLLARHPATAKRIAFKLAQWFVADQPGADVVDALAATFTRSDGDLRAVMHTLVRHPRFWDAAAQRSKFKTPYEFVISSMRATGAPANNAAPLISTLKQLGQPVQGCLTPDGYKATADAWMASDALLTRIDFVTRLGAGKLPLAGQGMASHTPVDAQQLIHTLGNTFSPATLQTVQRLPTAQQVGALLGSPDFMKH